MAKEINDIIENNREKLFSSLNEYDPIVDYLQEDLVKSKFLYIFYDRLQEMADIFAEKNEKIIKRYQEIMKTNENFIKKELIVQDKFLEYNDDIDNLIKNLDNNLLEKDEIITGKGFVY
jgi:hypothetical protein